MATRTATNEAGVNIELIIEKLSTNGTEELDRTYLKQLKTYCKSLDSNQEEPYNYLGRLVLHQLEKSHAQIRYGSLLIIEYLFERSHQFRVFICDHLNSYFELCFNIKGFRYSLLSGGEDFESTDDNVGINNNNNKRTKSKKPLQPVVWAKKLYAKALSCFKYWYNEFRDGYQALKSGYSFLLKRNVISISQINESTTNSVHQAQTSRTLEQSVSQQFQLEKFIKNFEDIERDASVLITQIDACFDLLIPKFKVISEEKGHTSGDDFHFRPMQGLSFSIILNAKVEIVRDSYNCDIIDNLTELCHELNQIYTGKLSQFHDNVTTNIKLPLIVDKVTELINSVKCLKMKIATIVWKFNDINIIASTVTSESDKGKDVCPQNGYMKDSEEAGDEEEEDDFEDVPDREDLFLMRKVEVEKERQLKEADKARVEGTSIDISSVDEHRCRAPLPSGKLCPRKDNVRCPFHGNIIPRDSDGLPIDPALKQKELDAKFQQKADEWKDPKYLREISAQTGRDLEGKGLKNKRKKYPNLIDIKQLANTPRKRLMRKISSKRVREKVSNDLNAQDEQTHRQYSQQWSYALEN